MNAPDPQILSIFSEALDRSSTSERAAFLDQVCGNNAPLRAKIEGLLQAHGLAGQFLEGPATVAEPAPPDERPGTIIGPYKLLEQIGEGGMGLVFVAEQLEPIRRKVALKVIKPGMDTREVIARFEAERQALALMDHPNIARVLDAGSTESNPKTKTRNPKQFRSTKSQNPNKADAPVSDFDDSNLDIVSNFDIRASNFDSGRPYFVMELVKGLSITQYCDDNRLTPRERLELFVHVCEAVQHAHQKGIIHRDIKPSNVLVTSHDGTPVVKVIDFGVAKAVGQKLTDKTVYTRLAQWVGTPLYMSPEQAGQSGLDVDTRSDIYSLGVLLYELLTGSTPFDKERIKQADFDEVRRIIREEDPPRPSTHVSTLGQAASTMSANRKSDPRKLSQLFRGELDWMVMKALEKDRNRRYDTASAFAADVKRYLNDEPVEACPPSVVYRARKFVRRHKAIVLSTSAIFFVVTLGSSLAAVYFQHQEEVKSGLLADKELEHEKALHAKLDAEKALKESKVQEAIAVINSNEAARQAHEAQEARKDAERERNAVNQNLYNADMRLGLVDWDFDNLARLSDTLKSHEPQADREDVRRWEWYYLLSLFHQNERTLIDYRSMATAVSWSPDGQRLATSTTLDGSVKVWDATSWRLLRTFALVKDNHHSVSWSPNGQQLAWGTDKDDSAVYVWDELSDKVTTLRGHAGHVKTVAWSADSMRLASAGYDSIIRIWKPTTGKSFVLEPSMGKVRLNGVQSVAWHPDGQLLASAETIGGLKIWQVNATWGEVLKDKLFTQMAYSVAWRPDGTQLALGTFDGDCLLFNTADWSLALRWKSHNGPVRDMAWNPDGSRLATTGNDVTKLWDPNSGICVQSFRGQHNGSILQSVAWHPDGKHLASAGGDVRIWSVPLAPQPLRLKGHSGAIQAIAWCGDGTTLRSLGDPDGAISEWNAVTGERLATMSVVRGSFGQFSPGAKKVVVNGAGDDKLQLLIYDAGSGKLIQKVKTESPGVLSFSPNGTQLAHARSGNLVIEDLRTNEVLLTSKDIGESKALSWSPDGRLLAVAGNIGSSDGGSLSSANCIHVFDLNKRQRTLKLRLDSSNVGMATAVTWSPDGRRVAAGDEHGLVVVWEVSTGTMTASVHLHTAKIEALAWSPDGRRIASGSADKAVRIWDPTHGEELLRFDIGDAAVTRLEWSPNGIRLAGACTDGSIRIWDASAGYDFVHSEAYYTEQVHLQLKQADALFSQHRAEFTKLLEKTLAESQANLGPDHLETLIVMQKLAQDYDIEHRPEEAFALYKKALEKMRVVIGPDEPETLALMNNLATLCGAMGRWNDAIELREQLLEKAKAKYGPDTPGTLTALRVLGQVYNRAGRSQEALAIIEPTLEKWKTVTDPDAKGLLSTMSQLTIVYQTAGKFDQANVMWLDLLEREKDRKANILADNLLGKLAAAQLKQRHYVEIEPLLRRWIVLRDEKTLGQQLRFNVKSMLGEALLGQKKYVEAEPLLLIGYEGMKEREAKTNDYYKELVFEAQSRIVRFYEATGNNDKADEWRKKLPVKKDAGK